MAVSSVLNDLALAAATERASASRKTPSKGRDGDFNSTLSATRRENTDVANTSKRSLPIRPQQKHDPRDHRSVDAQRTGKTRHESQEAHESREAKADASRDQVRHHDRAEPIHTSDRNRPDDSINNQDLSVSLIDQGAANTASPKEDTVVTSVEPTEAKPLDESSLVQTVAPAIPQVIQTLVIPVEAQIAVGLSGATVEPPKAETSEAETSEAAGEVATSDQAEAIASTTVASLFTAATQASLKSETAAAKAASQGTDQALQSIAELASGQSTAKTVAADKTKANDAKEASISFENASPKASQETAERELSFAVRSATKATFIEANAALTADKSIEPVAGLTATLASGTANSTQALKAPVASPSEALARADAPVPLQAVAVEIGMRAMRGSKEFSIRLDPEDLGRIDIKLEISEAGEVQAKLVVERVETLQLLQRDAKTLERAFDQAGLKTNPDGLQFSLKDPGQQRDGQNNQQSERSKFNATDNDIMAIEETTLRTFRYSSSATSGLDIRI